MLIFIFPIPHKPLQQPFNILFTHRVLAVYAKVWYIPIVVKAVFHQPFSTVKARLPFAQVMVERDKIRQSICRDIFDKFLKTSHSVISIRNRTEVVKIEFFQGYKAGACLPLPAPLGCFEQELAVKSETLERFVPQ